MQQPASETKHIQQLVYTFGRIASTNRNPHFRPGTHHANDNHHQTFLLNQRDDHGVTNGTTLWLGGQVLSYYLASTLQEPSNDAYNLKDGDEKQKRRRKRVIELGSGIGLTALVMHSMGWDVCATDVEPVLSTVLHPNILLNSTSHGSDNGVSNEATARIECRELDWMIPPEEWTWEDPNVIASSRHSSQHRQTASDDDDVLGERDIEGSKQATTTTGIKRGIVSPPYDLIITADTLYTPELVAPLFRTIHHLAQQSPYPSNHSSSLSTSDHQTTSPSSSSNRFSCPIYVAVERRDPQLMDRAFEECKAVWGFKVERVRTIKIRKALERAGVQWKQKAGRCKGEEENVGEREESPWDGVEIWKMRLPLSMIHGINEDLPKG
ncbi:hypothetical protein FRC17_000206 [Serendipita sp. 399]|nr:hypothetical protein FRC17_000206 [Serendipita sp. 399]